MLEHIAHVDDERWAEFGPGAVGVGWDLAIGLGLGLHLATGAAVDPGEVAAWSASDEGRRFMTLSSEGWFAATVAAGEDAAVAARRPPTAPPRPTRAPIPPPAAERWSAAERPIWAMAWAASRLPAWSASAGLGTREDGVEVAGVERVAGADGVDHRRRRRRSPTPSGCRRSTTPRRRRAWPPAGRPGPAPGPAPPSTASSSSLANRTSHAVDPAEEPSSVRWPAGAPRSTHRPTTGSPPGRGGPRAVSAAGVGPGAEEGVARQVEPRRVGRRGRRRRRRARGRRWRRGRGASSARRAASTSTTQVPVGRSGSTVPANRTPAAASSARADCPSASSPTAATSATSRPRDASQHAVLAADPPPIVRIALGVSLPCASGPSGHHDDVDHQVADDDDAARSSGVGDGDAGGEVGVAPDDGDVGAAGCRRRSPGGTTRAGRA